MRRLARNRLQVVLAGNVELVVVLAGAAPLAVMVVIVVGGSFYEAAPLTPMEFPPFCGLFQPELRQSRRLSL